MINPLNVQVNYDAVQRMSSDMVINMQFQYRNNPNQIMVYPEFYNGMRFYTTKAKSE